MPILDDEITISDNDVHVGQIVQVLVGLSIDDDDITNHKTRIVNVPLANVLNIFSSSLLARLEHLHS